MRRPQELREAVVCQELRGCADLKPSFVMSCAKPLLVRICAAHAPRRAGLRVVATVRGRRAWSLHGGRREWSLLMPSGGSSSS